MNIEDIKSPLPERKIEMPVEEEEVKPETVEPRMTLPTPEPEKNGLGGSGKKFDFKKNLKWIMVGVGILILILVAGILIKNGKKDKTVTLNYWGLWEDENVMNGVIADFEAKNPGIKIQYKRNQKNDYRSRLSGRLAKTGTQEVDIPDIFRIHNTWIPMFRDYLAPVPTETAKTIGLATDFFDVYSQDLKENGSYLSVPLMYDGLALFYNKDLLKTAGVELPKSWWELEQAAIKLTSKDEKDKIKIAGLAMGLTDNVDHWSDILGLMMKQGGINLIKLDTASETSLKDTLAFYSLFATQDKVWDETLPNSTTMFANGKLAFYFGPSWRVFDIEQINKKLNYGIMSVPQLTTSGLPNDTNVEARLTNIHWASYWTEGVNNKSKHQKEAWKFLEYLSSSETLEKMYAAESQIRSFGEMYPRKSLADKMNQNSKTQPFTSVANTATSWYLASETDDGGVNDGMNKYFGDAINSLIKNKDIDEVITTLKSGISQIKQKYNLKR